MPDDIEAFELFPLKPKHGPNLRAFEAEGYHDCAELDAIPPDVLRDRVRDAITRHFPGEEWERLQRIEENEQALLERVFAKTKVFT